MSSVPPEEGAEERGPSRGAAALSRRLTEKLAPLLRRVDAATLSDARRAHRSVLTLLGLVYLLTLHRGPGGLVNVGDSAKFQFLGRVHGLGHPPGNPLYLLLDKAMVALPLPLADSTKVNVMSALFGLGTLSFVFRWMVAVTEAAPAGTFRIGPVRTAALGAVLLGLGPTFWILSTEAEVYTLSTFCSSIATWGVVRWLQVRDARALGLAFFAWLVGFGNHLAIVALAPALLWALLHTRKDLRRAWTAVLWAIAGAAIGAGSYALIWKRASGPLAYSEFIGPFDTQHFIDYVTAKQYQGALGKFTYIDGVRNRLPALFTHLEEQWTWPLLLVAPFGVVRLYRASRPLTALFGVMTLAQLGIPFLYGIPDPEGYFMPALPVVALALASGLSALWESDLRAWLWGAAAAAFVALGAMRMQWFFLTEFSPDITLGAREGAVDFVFPTLFETIPEGSNFVVPCGHYGGVEVAIYYMLADETVRRKHIKFVRFSWSEWNDGLMPVTVVDETWAKTHVVCTVLKEDVQKLKDKGVPLQRLERTPYVRDWKEHRGAPLYCSAMSAAEAPR